MQGLSAQKYRAKKAVIHSQQKRREQAPALHHVRKDTVGREACSLHNFSIWNMLSYSAFYCILAFTAEIRISAAITLSSAVRAAKPPEYKIWALGGNSSSPSQRISCIFSPGKKENW